MMQRWYPFNDLRQMQNTMDRMWRRAGSRSNGSEESPDIETWAVPLDVLRKGDDTIVRASMPGVSPEDIRVSIEDNVLTIKAHTSQEFQDDGWGLLDAGAALRVVPPGIEASRFGRPRQGAAPFPARRSEHHRPQGRSQAGQAARGQGGRSGTHGRRLRPAGGRQPGNGPPRHRQEAVPRKRYRFLV